MSTAPPEFTNAADARRWQGAFEAFQKGDFGTSLGQIDAMTPGARTMPQVASTRAMVLIQLNRHGEAEQIFRSLIERRAGDPTTYVNLSEMLRRKGDLDEARLLLEQGLRMAPQMSAAHYNLGLIHSQQGNDAAAIESYQTALRLKPNYPRAQFNLANSLRREGRCYPARDLLKQIVAVQPNWAEAWQNLAAAQSDCGETDAAIASTQRAMRLSPKLGEELQRSLADMFVTRDEISEAVKILKSVLQTTPVAWWRQLRGDLLCSAVPESTEEIRAERARGTAALTAALEQEAVLLSEDHRDEWFEPPMQWGYHGEDDRPLKESFAKLFLRMIEPLELKRAGEIPHVGFVVTHGHEGVFERCLGGILQRLQSPELRVSIFCTRSTANTLRHAAGHLGGLIVETPSEVRDAARFIRDLSVDLLYYWEVGTDAFNYLMPFWKPARMQCISWGWPVTSGNPRIDFMLTTKGLEPENGGEHYSEKIEWIDGPVTYYPRPTEYQPWESAVAGRAKFKFAVDERLYMCQQNLRKWHPEFDEVIRRILEEDEKGALVCIGHTQETITRKLLGRLKRHGIDVEKRVRVFPFLDRKDYLEVLRTCDVSLDTPHYGGGANTIADAYAVGTPLVTMTGKYHRGRFATAVHTSGGLPELIAATSDEYVAKVLETGKNPDLRRSVSERMSQSYGELFESPRAVTALREVLLRLIRR